MRRCARLTPRSNAAIAACCLGLLCSFAAADARALLIHFDYTYDTANFFGDQQRKNVLTQAAQAFAGFTDALAAIEPTSTNAWEMTFDHPSEADKTVSLQKKTVPANTLLVYVGARDLGFAPEAVTLAEASYGGGRALAGSQDWSRTVLYRGQSSNPEDDFGPWGGSLTFNSNGKLKWFFELNASNLDKDHIDALTVSTHELAHILGFGEAPSWNQHVFEDPARFDGLYAERAYPSASTIPLDADLSHWHHEVGAHLMVAAPSIGIRTGLSELDRGGLCDAGWTHAECSLAPEPETLVLLLGLAMIGSMSGRRRPLTTYPPIPASSPRASPSAAVRASRP